MTDTKLAAGLPVLDYRQNPFRLVYEYAITENEPGKVNIHPVTYTLRGLKIAANVYTPADYDPNGSRTRQTNRLLRKNNLVSRKPAASRIDGP
jgi:hypothetical protein